MEKINSPFKRMIESSATSEFWWDSSPLVYQFWKKEFLQKEAQNSDVDLYDAQLQEFFNPENPHQSLVKGITTNPSLISQSIRSDPDTWLPVIAEKMDLQHNPRLESTYRLVYHEAIKRSAEKMRPLWDMSQGSYGWVSGQTDPRFMFDEEAMFVQGCNLALLSPNVMVKVPGTEQGYKVIRRLTAKGISTNSTLSFTLPQFIACANAVEEGLAEAYSQNISVTRWRSVITHMIGRFGSMGDMKTEANARDIKLTPYMERIAEIEILKKANEFLLNGNYSSTMLLSSLLVDDESVSTVGLSMHLENTTGGNFAYTCKPGFVADCLKSQSKLVSFRKNAINESSHAQTIETLLKLPSFVNAITVDGIAPSRFSATGPFLGTFKEVNDNIRYLLDFVDRGMEVHRDKSRIFAKEVA